MSKKSFGVSVLYMVLGLVFIAVIGLRTISTPELWTHLALGQNNGPISFIEGDAFVNTSWLYDKLLYIVWNLGGASLVIILNVIGLVAAFYLLIQVSKKWGGGMAQGFALLICGHLIFQTVDVGPRTVMMLFIALFLFILNTRRSPAVLFGSLIPLQILWTNMHSSFIYGPIIVALTAAQAAQAAKAPGARKKKQENQSGLFGILTAVLLICTVANPYFLNMHAQMITNIKSPAPAYWSSLFIEYYQIPEVKPLIFFTMILGAAGLITLKKRLPLVLTTLAIYSAFLVWTSPATAMLFAAMAFPFIVLSLTSISEYLNHSFKSILGDNAKVMAPLTGAILAVLILLSIVPIIQNKAYVKTGSASTFGLGVQENLFPNDLEPLFNDPAFPETAINLAADGGYLAFKYGRKCFIDYRSGTYDKELLKTLNKTLLGDREAYNTIQDKYRPEAYIINTLTPASAQGVATLLSNPIWKLAYFDGTTAVVLQNKTEFQSLLNNTALQQSGLAKLEAARKAYAARNSKGGNPAELIGAGKIYLAFNRPVEAKSIFSLILRGNAAAPAAWIGLGSSQLMLKQFSDSVASLRKATHQMPESLLAWATYASACRHAGLSDEAEAAVEKARKLAAKNREANKTEGEPKKESVKLKPTESLQDITIPE
ncbi:hypothetical protein [Pontiella agarivorans]|uniref:Uncharacterized protein n=1 Tax=Pontiella agarivorans TaxID=3038953 RepID=A0ABU5N1Q2_9BACT|nr:hypothetical protein [Pontiella agarivorans]MDZ8120384.1 hypothetical protein [Pontiella agarivorans]